MWICPMSVCASWQMRQDIHKGKISQEPLQTGPEIPSCFKNKNSVWKSVTVWQSLWAFLFSILYLWLQLPIIFIIAYWNNAICSQQACTWSILNENVYFNLFDCQWFDLGSECAHFSSTDNAWVFGHLVLLDPVLTDLVCVQMCPCMF